MSEKRVYGFGIPNFHLEDSGVHKILEPSKTALTQEIQTCLTSDKPNCATVFQVASLHGMGNWLLAMLSLWESL